MAEKVRRVDYFYFEIEDAPGQLAQVLGKLREANVNLLAYVAFPTSPGKGQVSVIPENPSALQTAARNGGLALSARKECFLVQGDDKVGAAHEVLKRLSDARINLVASAAATAGAGQFGMFIFVKPADLSSAAKALGV
jgi:hypothetical protein